jgi:hypothetical protein
MTAIPAITCCCDTGPQEPPLAVGLYVKGLARFGCKRTSMYQKVGMSGYVFPYGYVTGATQITTTLVGPYICNEGQPNEFEGYCNDITGRVANPQAGPPTGKCDFTMIVSEAEPLDQKVYARTGNIINTCGAQDYGNCRPPGPLVNQQDQPVCNCIQSIGTGTVLGQSARANCDCLSYSCSVPGAPQPCTPCPANDPFCTCDFSSYYIYQEGPPQMGGASYSFVMQSATEYDQTFHFVPSATTLPSFSTATYSFKFPTTAAATTFVTRSGSRRELRERYVPPAGGFATYQFPSQPCVACCKGELTGPPITTGYIDFFNESQYNTDFSITINAAANWTVACDGNAIVLVKNGTQQFSVSLAQQISAIVAGVASVTTNQVTASAGNMPSTAWGQPAKTSTVQALTVARQIYFRRIGDPFEAYQTKFARYVLLNFAPIWGTAQRTAFQGSDAQFAEGFSAVHSGTCPQQDVFAATLLQSGYTCPSLPAAGAAGSPPNPVPGCSTPQTCQAGTDIRQIVRAGTLVPFGAGAQEWEYSDYGCHDQCDSPCTGSDVFCQGNKRLDCYESASVLPPAGWYNWLACTGVYGYIQPTGGLRCSPTFGCGNTCVEACPGSKQPLFLTAPASVHTKFEYQWSLRRIV